MPEELDATHVATLTIASSQVPCSQLLSDTLERLQVLADTRPATPDGAAAAALLKGTPDLSDGDAVHRWLLNARRPGTHPRAWEVEHEASLALKRARRHSNLYTGRSCWCLTSAWAEYCDKLDTLLKGVHGNHPSPRWRVERNGTPIADAKGAASTPDLARALGLGSYFGLRDVHLANVRNLTMAVRVCAPPDALPTIEATWGVGRRKTAVRMVLLTPEDAALANHLEYGQAPTRADGGSWLQTWPEGLRELLTEWRKSPSRRVKSTAAAAQEILDAGYASLSARQRAIAWELAHQWCVPPAGLVTAAATIGQDVT